MEDDCRNNSRYGRHESRSNHFTSRSKLTCYVQQRRYNERIVKCEPHAIDDPATLSFAGAHGIDLGLTPLLLQDLGKAFLPTLATAGVLALALRAMRARGRAEEASAREILHGDAIRKADFSKNEMKDLGKSRARQFHFPNSYTYSKAVGELLVRGARERGDIRATIVRPAILESSNTFPFAGWNQGANTTAPLL